LKACSELKNDDKHLIVLPVEFYIKNAKIWNPNQILDSAVVHVVSGHLNWIKKSSDLKEQELEQIEASEFTVDAQGQVLMPMGIDMQVHLRNPGQSHKETIDTGLRAALRGGYAAVLAMPNTNPTIDSVEVLLNSKKEVAAKSTEYGIDIWWTAAFSKSLAGKELVDFEAIHKHGVWAFTDDGVGLEDDVLMEKVFEESARLGFLVLQHCEFRGHGASLAAGPVQEKLGLKAYPAEAEWKMIERDLKLLEKHPQARYHILHISSAKSVELLNEAKQKGLNVTGEVTPHHLFFCSEDIVVENTSFKMNPPLRSSEDRKVLQEALADGTIDFVSTDHAPHEESVKNIGFDSAAFGTTGMETSIRVLLKLHQDNILSAERLVEVFSTAPARLAKKTNDFGSLKSGSEFKAMLLDTEFGPQKVQEADLESLSKNNVFLGASLPGKITQVFTKSGVFRF